jgi:beta-lactamase class A
LAAEDHDAVGRRWPSQQQHFLQDRKKKLWLFLRFCNNTFARMQKQFALAATVLAAAVLAPAETPLELAVLTAVRDAHFERVVDFGAGNEAHPVKAGLHLPAAQIAHPPNVNVAVLQLDAEGRMVDRAYVLLSRDYPDGLVVPLDKDAGADSVRFLRWDIERSDGGTFSHDDGHQLTAKGWTNNPPLTEADDIVPGRTNAPYQFMASYPASLFKLMVAFHVMRMVDAGKTSLDTDYVYAIAGAKPESRKIRDWLDPMITVSDNHATSALLKMLHDQNEIEPLNREFRRLNLATLQINATSAADGRGWSPGEIHMTAFDVARLLWLVDGGPGELWRDAGGQPVTAKLLSDSSRAFLKKLLSEQGFNDCLTTANFPGADNVRAGIPSRVAERWINPTNGHVVVAGEDFGVDIRGSNARAGVNFAHKTGLTFNYGSDAGIVTSLPGKPFRHYVIAFLANLGNRYADEPFAARTNFPAFDAVSPIAYTQRIPALGKAIDDAVTKLSAAKESK